MKKVLKYTSLVLAICTALVCFVACGNDAKAKTFTCDAGLSITLTDKFYEKSIASQTFYLESEDVIFVAAKEEFSAITSAGYNPNTMTRTEYASLVKQNNFLTAETIEDTANDLVYFTYYKTISGKNFVYVAFVKKGTDAFWLCQFACEQKNETKLTSKFINWAKTIVVA